MTAKRRVLTQLLRDRRAKAAQRRGQSTTPWMKAKELDVMVDALATLSPEQCLEWGAGASTLYFPPRLPSIVSWLAIEHHRSWYETTIAKNQDPRVTIICIPPDHGDYPDTRKEGTYEDFRSYVDHPAGLDRRFDFIFIDGRARAACLTQAFDLVTDQGLVILHDANREYYVRTLPPFANLLRLTDYRTDGGGILLASRGRAIEEFIDVGLHQRLWRGHDRFAKWVLMK